MLRQVKSDQLEIHLNVFEEEARRDFVELEMNAEFELSDDPDQLYAQIRHLVADGTGGYWCIITELLSYLLGLRVLCNKCLY